VARGYAACLGSIALVVYLLRGLIDSRSPMDVLPTALAMTLAFTAVGWIVGAIADYVIRHSLESKFRQTVQQYQERQKQASQSNSA
jgi:response regulator of citrate/malate metabolism